jgi:hypothetical protein
MLAPHMPKRNVGRRPFLPRAAAHINLTELIMPPVLDGDKHSPCHGAAFAESARELAAWADARMVNRHDAWGVYRPEAEIGREFTRSDGSTGRLGPQQTVRGNLTPALLARHFSARDRSAIIGLHSADAGNLGKWAALDIDWHGPGSTAADVKPGCCPALVWAIGRRRLSPAVDGE